MTGHLVFSTLHTNDAVSTALRLVDMGAEPYLVASSLLAIVAQRLIRQVCESCAQEYHLTDQEKAWVKSMLSAQEWEANPTFKTGKGCNSCSYTGYQGRLGVYELLVMDEALITALQQNRHDEFVKAARRQKGYQPLAYNCDSIRCARCYECCRSTQGVW